VYIFDLATGKVGTWGPAGGGMWGRQGPAISSDGTMYTGTGDGNFNPEIGAFGNGIIGIKQNPQTKAAELVDYYGPSNAAWLWKRDLDMQVTPVIFPYKGKELMVDAGKECRMYLMDTESIGGDYHRTPLYRSPLICNEDVNFASAGIWGSLASWEDSKGTRWVLTPIWVSLIMLSTGFPRPLTRCFMRSTRRPEKSCGRARTRSRPGITGAGFRSPTAACTLRPSIALFIVTGSRGSGAGDVLEQNAHR